MKPFDPHKLPPCSLSRECLRLADELDAADNQGRGGIEPVPVDYDVSDVRLLEQLRRHVPHCPTCTAVLEQVRRVRRQQRSVLYDLLEDSEEAVPSTVASIMAAIAREQGPALASGSNHHQDLSAAPTMQLEEPDIISLQERRRQWAAERAPSRRSRTRTVFSLAIVAAIILSTIAVFRLFIPALTPTAGSIKLKHTTPTPTLSPSPSTIVPVGWNSAVIGLSYASSDGSTSRMDVTNYDPESGHSSLLVLFHLPANTQLDGISHDGLNLLYNFSSSGHTYYYTLSQLAHTGSFYTLNDGNAGNAIWIDGDNQHVLIATMHSGVIQVDIHTGAAKTVWPALNAVHLVHYRSPYLYYIGGEVPNALYRVSIAGGAPVQVTMPSPRTTFWLSPDGTTVFYANRGVEGEQAIYAVSNDGTNSRVLRFSTGLPIGYAADNALMLLQEVNGKFQIVKLGATPQEPDTVIMADVAPGASSLCTPTAIPGVQPICDSNAALAPFGHKLILHAYYPDGTSKILYDDLQQGRSHVLVNFGKSNVQVQLPGWDQLAVPGGTTLPAT